MGAEAKPPAHLVVEPGTVDEREVPIYDCIFVGRECFGVEERHRLVIDEPNASRNHLEIRLEPKHGFASVVDTSTNGTRLNGIRIERAVPVALKSGDRLTVDRLQLEFRSESPCQSDLPKPLQTIRRITVADFVMVVGDIVDFSAISHRTSSRLVLESLDGLLGELRSLLAHYRGTLSNYVGDAFFAVWELGSVPYAPRLALDFVVAADQRVSELAQSLAVRAVDGEPLRMGWGVSIGDAALSSFTGVLLGVVGDAANLAFRLAGLAARHGRSEVLVTDALWEHVAQQFPFEPLERVKVKGFHGTEAVRGLHLPLMAGSDP